MLVDILVAVLCLAVLVVVGLLVVAGRSRRVRINGTGVLGQRRPAGSPPLVLRAAGMRRPPGEPVAQPRPTAAGHPPAAPLLARPASAAALPADLAELLATSAVVGLGPDEEESFSGHIRTATIETERYAADGAVGSGATRPGGGVPGADRWAEGGLAVGAMMAGLEGPTGWNRIVETENARLLRYRRPVTVVVAELDGLRRLAERVGDEPVRRLLPVVAEAFRREGRGSDWIARIGEGRFIALLPETDEIQAINYVERVRVTCEPWLASAAVPLRLAMGWSSPPASADLDFAVRQAEERMHIDRRTPRRSLPPPRILPATFVALSALPAAGEGPGDASSPARVVADREPRDATGAGLTEIETTPAGPHDGLIERSRGRRRPRPALDSRDPGSV